MTSRPGMDVLPGADVAFADFAASRGGDAGIAEIDFGQIELGLGLLDGRSLDRELSEIAVDVALFCELVEHLLRALSIRMDNAELGRTLDQVCLRLEDRRKGLIEIWRHLAEIFAATGLRRQPQRDTGLVNLCKGFIDLRVGSRQRFLRPIVLLTAFSRGPEQLLCPTEVNLCQRQHRLALIESGDASMQKGYLVVEVLHGALQFPAPAPGFCFNTARLGFGRLQVSLGLCHPGAIIVSLDLDQQVARLDPLKIVHGHSPHVPFDLGAERRDVAANIGVVRNLPDCQANPTVPLSSK